MNTGIWMVEYRSLLSDDRRWVRATELGQHSTKRRAEKAAKDGLSAAYEHVRVVNIKESPNAGVERHAPETDCDSEDTSVRVSARTTC